MDQEIITTKDKSHSLVCNHLNEVYHSRNGAISESIHVFINNGLKYSKKKKIDILEVSLGTGLNTLLTLHNSNKIKVKYVALEPFPVKKEIYEKLNFSDIIKSDKSLFFSIHNSEWERNINLSNNFILNKQKVSIQNYIEDKKFDIIYYDAFAPTKQPEMWTKEILEKCFNLLKINGFMITYCSKGSVKRTLSSLGFKIQSLPGPPGKREMIRAIKDN